MKKRRGNENISKNSVANILNSRYYSATHQTKAEYLTKKTTTSARFHQPTSPIFMGAYYIRYTVVPAVLTLRPTFIRDQCCNITSTAESANYLIDNIVAGDLTLQIFLSLIHI